ncbi:hypothetical protein [Paenibacillus radicis (ex Gao et al. 2016)]|nr:hypothetical protein [Paenibacillus radicis (ex Gao et al. 2016)]
MDRIKDKNPKSYWFFKWLSVASSVAIVITMVWLVMKYTLTSS